jgi:murein DD-endopeptidase MepM/ murein hydrolase activator NlpD
VLVRRRKLLRAADGAFGLQAPSRVTDETYRPEIYGGRGSGIVKSMYDSDHADTRSGGRFRWMLSTCLAAAVGAIAILVVIYGSSDNNGSPDGLMPALQSMSDGAVTAAIFPTVKNADGLKWVSPKSDRLQLTSGALSTRYIIHESSKSRRDGREYVRQKPYARIVARLAPVPSEFDQTIPPFNPFKLYANNQPVAANADLDEAAGSGLSRTDVSVKVVELLGGILPGEDGQELDVKEVADIVERTSEPAPPVAAIGDGADDPIDGNAGDAGSETLGVENAAWQPRSASSQETNTTEIYKAAEAPDDPSSNLEGGELFLVKVGASDTLNKILTQAGAPLWQARAMIEAAQSIFPESALVPGQEVRITLVPSLTQADVKEPARFSIFSDGHDHLVTVTRNASGEFVASTQSLLSEELRQASASGGDGAQNETLYASLFHAALTQNVPPDTIQQVLRVNAFDTDFRRRVRPGDTVEFFFDMKDEQSTDGPPGELLYTSINSGGAAYKFYRFRTPDGVIDYFDEKGNNSKRFLMRKPVRGEDARLTSGYGMRFHPLLNTRKMHTGVDWASTPGTPILASGNGTIEEAGHKGYYGNYIRIRHANGYNTAYAHMSRFASGVATGVKVRQGQVIGYVGTTGLSSGPHLHFEVLVNGRFVDPMSIQVPRERKLEGKELAEFQKERARIEDLMRRAPVMTANK